MYEAATFLKVRNCSEVHFWVWGTPGFIGFMGDDAAGFLRFPGELNLTKLSKLSGITMIQCSVTVQDE